MEVPLSTESTTELAARPPTTPDSQPFWDAIDAGRIEIQRCEQCRRWQHPPLERCRKCGGALAHEPISGSGTLYSHTRIEYPAASGFEIPYTVGLVDLDEQPGLRLTVQLRGSAAENATIGGRVEVELGAGPMGTIPVVSEIVGAG
jgi:uncharacterized OB-fold protein